MTQFLTQCHFCPFAGTTPAKPAQHRNRKRQTGQRQKREKRREGEDASASVRRPERVPLASRCTHYAATLLESQGRLRACFLPSKYTHVSMLSQPLRHGGRPPFTLQMSQEHLNPKETGCRKLSFLNSFRNSSGPAQKWPGCRLLLLLFLLLSGYSCPPFPSSSSSPFSTSSPSVSCPSSRAPPVPRWAARRPCTLSCECYQRKHLRSKQKPLFTCCHSASSRPPTSTQVSPWEERAHSEL